MIARLAPPAVGVRNERFKQPHQRAPLFHGAAEIMHRVLVRALRIGQRNARFCQYVAGDGPALGCNAGFSSVGGSKGPCMAG